MTRPNPRLASYQAARPVDEIDVTAHAPLV